MARRVAGNISLLWVLGSAFRYRQMRGFRLLAGERPDLCGSSVATPPVWVGCNGHLSAPQRFGALPITSGTLGGPPGRVNSMRDFEKDNCDGGG